MAQPRETTRITNRSSIFFERYSIHLTTRTIIEGSWIPVGAQFQKTRGASGLRVASLVWRWPDTLRNKESYLTKWPDYTRQTFETTNVLHCDLHRDPSQQSIRINDQ
jgi:hypothetical protein